jgi:hypothetical protein
VKIFSEPGGRHNAVFAAENDNDEMLLKLLFEVLDKEPEPVEATFGKTAGEHFSTLEVRERG